MWQKTNKGFFRGNRKRFVAALIGLCLGCVLLIGCGSSNTATMSAAAPVHMSNSNASGGNTDVQTAQKAALTSGSANTGNASSQVGPQYLQKSLQVTMQVQDTRATASDLQQWLSGADPQATSDGVDYEQVGDNQYNVTLTYLVDVAHYTQVENYLRDYAGQQGRMLVTLHETVQDLTNDYIDTQTRLTDLRAEQQRLLGFLNQAQNLNDTLNIEQQLTQVEGQINSIEAHLNALKGQTSFYIVTVTLQPLGSALPPSPTPSPWSAIPVWQGAWTAVLGVWQVLLTVVIWLAAFSVYIIPAGVVIWLIRRWRWSRSPLAATAAPASRVAPAQPKDANPE